jgi:uncharacterized protein YdhG (YjbR/CyaY superfamily)
MFNTAMKKAKPAARRSSAKGSAAPKTVDEYLAGVSEPARSTLTKVRAVIRATVPEAIETISYRIPMFKYKGRPLVWFAAFSNHCSLFPGASVVEAFKSELKGFAVSKGTLPLPVDKPLSTTLVKKLLKARISQNEQKKQR